MKTHILISAFILFSISSFASNTKTESQKNWILQESEMNEILNHVLDLNEKQVVSQIEITNKIIIMDSNFDKVREVNLNEDGEQNNQNTLRPLINRSHFIAEIHNVSFYMLEKK